MLVSRDVILTYVNQKGMALSMSFFSPFFLLGCREQMQNNISSEKVSGCDGEIFTGMATEARHIEITGFFDAALGRRGMEGELKKVFNTGCGGTLEYYHKTDKKRYSINCFVEKAPDVIFNNARVEFAINLKCLDPFWYGEEIIHNIPPYSLTFTNVGDSTAGVVFELSGTATEPFISKGTERIAFIGNISFGIHRILFVINKIIRFPYWKTQYHG